MFLTVVHPQQRWYEAPARGTLRIGTEPEGDVQISGHNLRSRHVVLHFEARRVRVEVVWIYGVRIDGQLPRPKSVLELGSVLDIGPWRFRLEPEPPTGIEAIDEAFAGLASADEREVYADSLEDRGRTAEATLMRAATVDPALAVRTPPAWRRRFLPLQIEACNVAECPRAYRPKCEVCQRAIPIIGHLATAREYALTGNPVAVDPAVRRWRNDLRAPVVHRNRIEMGQPTDRD